MGRELEVGEKVWLEARSKGDKPIVVPGTVLSIEGKKVWLKTAAGDLCASRAMIARQGDKT